MGLVDQSLVFWDLAVEVAKRSGVDEACTQLTALFQLWHWAACSHCSYCSLLQARLRKLRSAQLMRSLAAKTPFTLAAVELVGTHLNIIELDALDAACNLVQMLQRNLQAATISEVTHLIKTQRQDYVQPGGVRVCRMCRLANSEVHMYIYYILQVA